MNTVIVLSGGIGTRMGKEVNCPKQYLKICGKPVIGFCLDTFQNCKEVDSIVIVADKKWYTYMDAYIIENGITKFRGYAEAGKCRQMSVYNGLKVAESFMKEQDVILVHDAVRPFVTKKIIASCFDIPRGFDGIMPVLPVTDTIYQSADGREISQLHPKNELFKGQAPESFYFGKYLKVHKLISEDELMSVNGSSEIAYQYGMKIALIRGDIKNIKITTLEDLKIAEMYMRE